MTSFPLRVLQPITACEDQQWSGHRGSLHERSTTAQRLAVLLTDLHRRLRTQARRERGAPHALTRPQFEVLEAMAQAELAPEVALATRLRVTSATLVRLVEVLERQGFVTRNRGDDDRRVVRIGVTAEGTRVLREYADWRAQRLAPILRRLPAPTVTALIRDLAVLRTALEDQGRTADADPTS